MEALRLRNSAIRRGDAGERVVRLQDALHSLGYDVGPRDGVFGYLTEDAVRQFQREHKLRVDGVAGARVFEMLSHPRPTRTRRMHTVAPGESLADVARRYGVTVEYLRRANRLYRRRPLYEGQRLVIRYRYVLGASHRVADAREVSHLLRTTGGRLSGVGAIRFEVTSDGSITGSWDTAAVDACASQGLHAFVVLRTGSQAEDGAERLRRVVRSRRRRRRFVEELEALLRTPGIDGAVLDFGPWSFGDGAGYLRLVEAVKASRIGGEKQLIAGVPFLGGGVRDRLLAADLNLPRLARAADLVLLQAHHPVAAEVPVIPPSSLDAGLRRLTRAVPVWKLLLGVFAGARVRDDASGEARDLSYQQGMVEVYARGGRPKPAEGSALTVGETAGADGGSGRVWLAGARAVEESLLAVERHNLYGVMLTPLSGEDGRIWPRLSRLITPLRHEADEADIGIN